MHWLISMHCSVHCRYVKVENSNACLVLLSQGSDDESTSVSLGHWEAEELSFRMAWIANLWSRIAAAGLAPDVSEDRAEWWATKVARCCDSSHMDAQCSFLQFQFGCIFTETELAHGNGLQCRGRPVQDDLHLTTRALQV